MKLKKYLTIGIIAAVVVVGGLGFAVTKFTSASYQIKLITSEEAKKIMLEKVPEATILEFSYDGDEKTPKYDGTLIKGEYEYEIDVNAQTGEIIKFEEEKIAISNSNNSNSSSASATTNEESNSSSSSTASNVDSNTTTNTTQSNVSTSTSTNTTQSNTSTNASASTATSSYIGAEKAKSIMLGQVSGGTIIEFSFDGDEITPKYEGTLITAEYEYDIDINAKTGAVIKVEKEKRFVSNNTGSISQNSSSTSTNTSTSTTSYIGEEKAKSIMLGKVPGATIVSFYLDNDETPEYEGELIKDNVEYEISVDAKTGAILEFSSEPIDRYDD